MKEPTIIAIYDPINGTAVSDGKINSAIETLYAVVQRDNYLKTTFGSLIFLQSFIKQASQFGIEPDKIQILHIIEGKEEEIDLVKLHSKYFHPFNIG